MSHHLGGSFFAQETLVGWAGFSAKTKGPTLISTIWQRKRPSWHAKDSRTCAKDSPKSDISIVVLAGLASISVLCLVNGGNSAFGRPVVTYFCSVLSTPSIHYHGHSVSLHACPQSLLFLQHAGIALSPDPILFMRVLPMKMYDQHYTRKPPLEFSFLMIKLVQEPQDCLALISAGINNPITSDQRSALEYQTSLFLQDAGITVSPDPTLVTCVLPMPKIHYGNPASSRTVTFLPQIFTAQCKSPTQHRIPPLKANIDTPVRNNKPKGLLVIIMGINGLWELLEPAAKTIPVISLALQGCYIGPAPHLPYVVGVDASGWFEQCQQGKWHRAHTQTGQNPALRTFLFRLARLAQYPLQLIFCYDGNQRPGVKRGHIVSLNEHWMVKPTQRILDAFNTEWIVAAGEAEAQLALMNRAGIIDAVMTDDSDIFIFGAQTVLRNSTFLSDTIKIYTVSTIQEHIDHSLTGDAFVTIAICCGGDYDKNGLPGAMHSGNQDLSLQRWQNIAEYHLASNPTGKMGRSHPALAHSLSDSFPNPGIINLYAHPAVTPLTELPKLRPPTPPNLARLAALIQQLLGWDSKKLLSTFRTTVWPVVILHELLEDLANNSPMSNEIDLASGCTRAVFLNRASCPKKAIKATLRLLEESAEGCQDDLHKYVQVWLADRIYDCWVQTMFLSSSGDPQIESSSLSTSRVVPQLESSSLSTSCVVPQLESSSLSTSCVVPQLESSSLSTSHVVPQLESSSLSTSHVVHGSSAGVVPVGAASPVSIIDLTQEEDEVVLADGIIIDLTGDNEDDCELIDLTL
ncbi:uncharacterized protein F5891DRAFT_1191747 [Suillus fuscotomentosus]|uniref:XPG-I domain-containing protein n=1 Tax=Suillus fuscotomentosus TaxID=1912939 RepID=A0AAD4HIB5_9AGAM|nr:uncharacterized protein F5891DRAFT_1191747 [Suillus fuscotomentosus]KAG1897552.1 hypothetical protein F5891DRAFT_1191747 [Suillus fuscotomentosus]